MRGTMRAAGAAPGQYAPPSGPGSSSSTTTDHGRRDKPLRRSSGGAPSLPAGYRPENQRLFRMVQAPNPPGAARLAERITVEGATPMTDSPTASSNSADVLPALKPAWEPSGGMPALKVTDVKAI